MIEINWNPSRKELRTFAALLTAFIAIVAALWFRRTGTTLGPSALVGVVWTLCAIGAVAPAVMRPIYVTWMVAVFPIGWVVSHIVMAIVFYLVVTPVGLLMRATGRDPMQRGFDKSAATYWTTRDAPPSADRYFKQF